MKKFMKTQLGRFAAGLLALLIVAAVSAGVQHVPFLKADVTSQPLLIVAAVSAGVQHVPFLKADVTSQQLMSMSEKSLEIVKGLDQEVTISYLATDSGKELWVEELAMKYAAVNSCITYEMVSPTSSKASQLAMKAGESLAENALVVSCGDRAAAITADEMYSVTYNQMYLYYSGEYVVESQRFIADEQLANAILYVTRNDLPVVYALTGHGETAAGSFVLDQLRMSNVVLRTLNLTDEVPEDAAAVMISAPTVDISAVEKQALLAYLKNGGDLILMTGYMMENMPNLNALTSYYGMEQVCGVIMDTAEGYCYSADYPQYIKPDLAEHEAIATLAGAGLKPILSLAGGMKRSAVGRSGLTVTELMTTSGQAHMKTTLEATTLALEEGDPVGPFTVAMAAEEGETRIVWYGSGSFMGDNDIGISGGYNLYLLEDTLTWMMPITERVDIEGGDLMAASLNIPGGQTNLSIALMFVPALIALAVGLIVKKRK